MGQVRFMVAGVACVVIAHVEACGRVGYDPQPLGADASIGGGGGGGKDAGTERDVSTDAPPSSRLDATADAHATVDARVPVEAAGPRCGDAVVDPGEKCDDGADSPTCDADCTLAACGDGYLNGAAGEECDEFGGESPACDPSCKHPPACDPSCVCEYRLGHRYMFCPTSLTWSAAEAACEKVDMRLARLDDGGEATWLLRQSSLNAASDGWIGASDHDASGTWRWVDGQTFWTGGLGGSATLDLYSNWNVGQPSTANACASLLGTFDAHACTETRHFACEAYPVRPQLCGNGVVDAGEACDDGTDSSNCDADCTKVRCGDGYLNRKAGELCDGGGTDPECPTTCRRPARAPGEVVLYDFNESTGTVVFDHSATSPALDLTIATPAAVTWVPGGLRLDGATDVRTTATPSKVVDACIASNRLSLEAWVTPASTTDGGPRSILSLSSGSTNRNFLLGQQAQSFWTLGRTTSTTPDALPAIISAPLNRGALTHLVYTRDDTGTETIYVDASPVGFSFRTGDFSGWDAATSLSIGNEPGAAGEDFHGTVHLAAVYCRTLSASEIFQNYLAGP